MSYKKPRTKPKTQATTTVAVKPSKAAIIFRAIMAAFAPLSLFQKALYYEGEVKKQPSAFSKWASKQAGTIAILEKVLFFSFVIFSLFVNPYLLLVLPAVGGLIFYRNRVKFLWWKVKVFVLQRDYYEHRRELYKQGTLLLHLKHKQPKRYSKATIWGQSESIQLIIFRRLQKENSLTKKEYIKL